MKEQRRVFQKISKIKKEELSTQRVELASRQIVEKLFEEGRQWILSHKADAKKMSSIASEKNKEAAKLSNKMENAANKYYQSAKNIGFELKDLPEVEATLMYAEKIKELQNAYAIIFAAINKNVL